MASHPTNIANLKKLLKLAQTLLNDAEGEAGPGNGSSNKAGPGRRQRRSGKELLAFRKMLKSERKKGIPVAKLAREHGISLAYIYQLD